MIDLHYEIRICQFLVATFCLFSVLKTWLFTGPLIFTFIIFSKTTILDLEIYKGYFHQDIQCVLLLEEKN